MTYQQAWADVARERIRQQTEEGFDEESDDKFVLGQLLRAAEAYRHRDPSSWPWGSWNLKFRSRRRDLTKAGALYLAEADRLVRQANRMKAQARECANEAALIVEMEMEV